MHEQHRRHHESESFTDLPLQNSPLINTYRRDLIERRSRENLSGICKEQEFDERIFETTVKSNIRPVGILKNSPSRNTSASTPDSQHPSTSSNQGPLVSQPTRYELYDERRPFVQQQQQPNYQNNQSIIYTQPNFQDQPTMMPAKNINPFDLQQNIYRPTTESVTSASTRTHKTYDKLAEVYSTSGDTAQFASNLKTFLDENIPGFVWVFLLSAQILLGLLSIFIGTFNYPFCNAQPNIPVYLIVSGILLIMNGSIRLCTYIPTPGSSNRSNLVTDLCIYGIEGVVLLGIVITNVLGCIWVYGSKWYIHFHQFGIFEEYSCNWALYWFAWWSVTLHLIFGALVILSILCILMYGSFAV